MILLDIKQFNLKEVIKMEKTKRLRVKEKMLETIKTLINLAENDNYTVNDIKLRDWGHYGLKVYHIGDREFAFGNDEQCQNAVKDNIEQSIWAFETWFIEKHTDLSGKEIDHLKDLYEDGNNMLLEFIKDINDFVKEAVRYDGRGHFLGDYDGNEYEYEINGEYYYLYRLH